MVISSRRERTSIDWGERRQGLIGEANRLVRAKKNGNAVDEVSVGIAFHPQGDYGFQ
jgi:hypothetical protein